jgi:uncharacterized protein
VNQEKAIQDDQPGNWPAAPDLEEQPYTPLDERVIPYWRLSGAVGWIFPMLLLLGLAIGVGGAVLGQPRLALALWAGWGVGVIFWTWWYPPRAYAAWGYRRDGHVLELRSGVWFRVVRLLPLSRLQHVDLQRGPLERWFGLASLVLYTAGTQEAAIGIPGLPDAVAQSLRDELVAAGGDDGV